MPPRNHRRLEDPRFVTGKGRYVADLVQPEDLHLHFHRSPVAHGRLTEVDITDASESPGVRRILTAQDIDLRPIPGGPLANDGMERPLLASSRVRYVGDLIAVVVADTPVQAADASGLIWADIEPLEVVVEARQSAHGTPLFESGNVVAQRTTGSEFTDRGFDVSATISVYNQRLAPASIEGLAIRAEPVDGDRLIVHCGHQAPHRLRDQLADQLELDPGLIRVITPDVGGAFGLKGMLFPEYILTCAAALELGHPVAWVEERREHFQSGVHGRSQHHRVTLQGDTDGRMRRAHIEILADVGAYPHTGVLIPSLTTFVAQGLYDIEEFRVDATTVVTNLAPTGSYRGAGRPEAAFALERAVDAFARAAELDPAAVRMKNFIPASSLPYTTHTGALYDSGDYAGVLEKALKMVEIEGVRAQQRDRLETGGDPIGIGIGAFVERSGGALGAGEFGQVEVTDDGSIVVRTGSASQGQGHETVWARLAADLFRTTDDLVTFIAGDTDLVDDGVGTFASRSAQVGASAIHRTGTKVLERAKAVGARMLEASPADLEVVGGRVQVVGDPASGLSLAEVATFAREEGEVLEAAEMFVPDNQAFPFGAHIAVVEVILETGEVRVIRLVAVDDCGVVLDPMIVNGQVVGSLAQGYGQAILEGIEYSESGDPLTASFMDYLLPAAMDTPSFELGRTVSPAPSNPLGAKGTGEAGCIGAPPAIVNATLDALGPYGVTDLAMPLRPHRVWSAIQEAKKG